MLKGSHPSGGTDFQEGHVQLSLASSRSVPQVRSLPTIPMKAKLAKLLPSFKLHAPLIWESSPVVLLGILTQFDAL